MTGLSFINARLMHEDRHAWFPFPVLNNNDKLAHFPINGLHKKTASLEDNTDNSVDFFSLKRAKFKIRKLLPTFQWEQIKDNRVLLSLLSISNLRRRLF